MPRRRTFGFERIYAQLCASEAYTLKTVLPEGLVNVTVVEGASAAKNDFREGAGVISYGKKVIAVFQSATGTGDGNQYAIFGFCIPSGGLGGERLFDEFLPSRTIKKSARISRPFGCIFDLHEGENITVGCDVES